MGKYACKHAFLNRPYAHREAHTYIGSTPYVYTSVYCRAKEEVLPVEALRKYTWFTGIAGITGSPSAIDTAWSLVRLYHLLFVVATTVACDPPFLPRVCRSPKMPF